MKILIDDIRIYLPDGSNPDLIVKNYEAAELLFCDGLFGDAEDLFIDHDLGGEKTGYDLMCLIERGVLIHNYKLPNSITCVSDNPPGRARIQQVIDKLYNVSLR